MKEDTCKYCHNFYSTLCMKCRVDTGNPTDPDFSCVDEEKQVQKNWKNYEKAKKKLAEIAGSIVL